MYFVQSLIQLKPSENGSSDPVCQSVMKLLTSMLSASWDGQHTCCNDDSQLMAGCSFCEFITVWFQLSALLIQFFTPDVESPMPVQDLPAFDSDNARMNPSQSVHGMHFFHQSSCQVSKYHVTMKLSGVGLYFRFIQLSS